MDKISKAFSNLSLTDPVYGKLSNFELLKKIGNGQFSVVYKAKCNNKHVALKTIPILDINDTDPKSDCMNEIDVLQKLNHPNVIKYLGSFYKYSLLYIVLEFADGGDLSEMIMSSVQKNCLISEKTIWQIFAQIASGIQHLHSKRIIHRDIKPANIFLTSNRVVKIGDFGFGRFLKAKVFTEALSGTPYYMAPERVGERAYDFKADIWSLGCVLYELATLQSPFYGERINLKSLYQKIENGHFPPIPCDRYSIELDKLVSACLAVDTIKRPNICCVLFQAEQMNEKFSNSSLKT